MTSAIHQLLQIHIQIFFDQFALFQPTSNVMELGSTDAKATNFRLIIFELFVYHNINIFVQTDITQFY